MSVCQFGRMDGSGRCWTLLKHPFPLFFTRVLTRATESQVGPGENWGGGAVATGQCHCEFPGDWVPVPMELKQRSASYLPPLGPKEPPEPRLDDEELVKQLFEHFFKFPSYNFPHQKPKGAKIRRIYRVGCFSFKSKRWASCFSGSYVWLIIFPWRKTPCPETCWDTAYFCDV